MRYGFVIPAARIDQFAGLARAAEEAGWDGAFIPDCIYIDSLQDPESLGMDPWIVLTTMALATERIRLGTMITPLSRRRPWKVARETVTLDHLSHGRLILPVGLGALDDAGFGRVGEATSRRERAELLDESLDILRGLWSGEPFSYDGTHYHLENLRFQPRPVQQPHIPIWVVAAWPAEKSVARAFKWDGMLIAVRDEQNHDVPVTPEHLRAIRAAARERRGDTPFDLVMEGDTPDDDPAHAAAVLAPLEEAGLTWWMVTMWSVPNAYDEVLHRIRQGPPRAPRA
jgi:alkanesulfonate monooxygenase SsuD/methylene tetrahydromethanopterin reductase-like flavin-dependent oxidoreductase (luciferase family)